MASDLQIQLGVVTTQFTAGLKVAGEKLNAFATQSVKDIEKVSASSQSLNKVLGSLMSAFVGAQILKGLFDVALAADKVTGALKIAANTAHNLGKEFDPVKVKTWLEAFSLSKAGGGYGLDELAHGMQVFASSGENAAQSERLTALAANFAAGRVGDYGTAVNLVNKVITGHVALLSRYGIAVKDAAGKTLSGAAAMRMLEKAFAGDAEKRADTLVGTLGRLNNNLSILKEQLAVIIEPVITKLVGKLNDLINGFRALSPEMQKTILAGAGILGSLTALGMFMPLLINGIRGVITILRFFATTTLGLVVTAIAGLILWIKYVIDNYQAFYKAQESLINWMGNAWRSIVQFMRDRFNDIATGLKGLVQIMQGQVQAGILNLQGAFKGNIAGWVSLGTSIGHAVVSGVETGWAKLKGAWAKLMGGQTVLPFDFGGVPQTEVTTHDAPEKTVKDKPGKVPKTFHGDQYIIWDIKPFKDIPPRLYRDQDKDYSTKYPVPKIDWLTTMGSALTIHLIDPLKIVREGLKQFAVSLGIGFQINQQTGKMFFSWQEMLLQGISKTKAFADIQLVAGRIMGVFAKVLDALRPVIDLLLRGLILLVNGFITFYNIFARLLRALGLHVALLDKISSNFEQAAVPFIRIIHDIPTLNELATGKIAPLHPAEFYQGVNQITAPLAEHTNILKQLGSLIAAGIVLWGIANILHTFHAFLTGVSNAAIVASLAVTNMLLGAIFLKPSFFGFTFCPEIDQLIETRDRNFIRAGDLVVGDYLRSPSVPDKWNRVNAVEIKPTVVYRFTTDVETIGVNREHRVKDLNGKWVEVRNLVAGDLILRYPHGLLTIKDVACVGIGHYAAIDCEDHEYVLGTSVGHNDSGEMGKMIIHTVKAATGARGGLGGLAGGGSSADMRVTMHNNFSGPIHGYDDVDKLGKDLAESTARAMRGRSYLLDRH